MFQENLLCPYHAGMLSAGTSERPIGVTILQQSTSLQRACFPLIVNVPMWIRLTGTSATPSSRQPKSLSPAFIRSDHIPCCNVKSEGLYQTFFQSSKKSDSSKAATELLSWLNKKEQTNGLRLFVHRKTWSI